MKRLFAALALAWLLPSSPARADLILSFTTDGSPTNFFVPVGQSIQIPVYVIERNQAPLTTALSTNGLFSGGVKLNFSNSIPGGAIATSAMGNPGWSESAVGYPFVDNTNGMAGVSNGAGTGQPVVTTTGSPPRILVGTFTFQGNILNDVVSIGTTNPHGSGYTEFLSGDGFTQIERQSFANIFWTGGNTAMPISYTTTITVTPEPTLILCVGAPVALWAAWRQRRRASPDAAP